jgi:hypothetical protein
MVEVRGQEIFGLGRYSALAKHMIQDQKLHMLYTNLDYFFDCFHP